MRHIPIGEFTDKVSEYVAAAEAGEEIVVTREGKEIARLSCTHEARQERKRAAVEAMYALGKEMRAKYGPTTAVEIKAWIEEGRR